MKLKRIITGSLLALTMAFGVGVGISANRKADVKPAEAGGDTINAGTIIYLDPTSFNPSNPWTGGYLGAWCHYHSNGNFYTSDMWEEFWYDNLSGKYMMVLSYNCKSFTMARYATSGGSRNHQTSWGGDVWNQGNFEFASGKNYLYATGFMTGTWQTLTYELRDFTSNGITVMNDGFDDGGAHQASLSTSMIEGHAFKIVTSYNGSPAGDTWFGYSSIYDDAPAKGTYLVEAPTDGNILVATGKGGDYEFYLKWDSDSSSRKIWAQVSSATEANAYAEEFLSIITCTSSGVNFTINQWNNVSGTGSVEYKFSKLTYGAQNVLKGTTPSESGSTIQRCIARYDRILSKYGYGTASGQYHDFMGRTPARIGSSAVIVGLNNKTTTNSVIVVVVVSITAIAAAGFFFFFYKKKNQ